MRDENKNYVFFLDNCFELRYSNCVTDVTSRDINLLVSFVDTRRFRAESVFVIAFKCKKIKNTFDITVNFGRVNIYVGTTHPVTGIVNLTLTQPDRNEAVPRDSVLKCQEFVVRDGVIRMCVCVCA